MSITPKKAVNFDAIALQGPAFSFSNDFLVRKGIDLLVQHCHAASYNRGWWHDPITGVSLIPGDPLIGGWGDDPREKMRRAWFPYVIATKIALIHSEVSEGLEAFRTDEMDDKIPFMGITAEMGDAVIRIADLMACLKEYYKQTGNIYDLGDAIMAKIPYNAVRADHDFSNRKKKF